MASHAAQIASVLEDVSSTSKIWFNVNNVQVDPNRLAEAGKLIRTGKIKVGVDSTSNLAGYYNKDNELYFPDLGTDTILRRALIIHEGVHIVNDIGRITVFDIDDECAAYVAQAAYIVANDFTDQWKTKLDPASCPYAAMALGEQVVLAGVTDPMNLLQKEASTLRSRVTKQYGITRKDYTTYEGVPGQTMSAVRTVRR